MAEFHNPPESHPEHHGPGPKSAAKARLAAALRDNLRRRRVQAKGRQALAAEAPEAPPAALEPPPGNLQKANL